MSPCTGNKAQIAEQYHRLFKKVYALLYTLDQHYYNDNNTSLTVVTDIFETDQAMVLEFELPGLCIDDISITLQGSLLTLEADKKPPPAQKQQYFCIERRFGKIRQTVRLPDQIDSTLVYTEYKRGLLRVICPKGQKRSILIKEQ